MSVPLAGFDVIGFDILEEEGHIGGQRERYGMQMRCGNAVGAFLIPVHLLVGDADEHSQLRLGHAHVLPPQANALRHLTLQRKKMRGVDVLAAGA